MRKLYFALIAIFLSAQFSCGPTYVVQNPAPAPPPPPPPPAEVSYQNFYDALSPYGEWINNPDYGYVWMPNAGPDFKPYATNGNWVYTDEGWAWNSNYSWGWAPFHYGRWFFEDGYGWMWMPGNEWAPAWVSWRRSPDYYGWAPLGPSVSMNVAVGGGYNPPPHYWSFVPHQYVTSPHINNYYVNEQQNVTIINNTTVIHNTTIVNNTYNNTTVVNNNRVTVNNYAGGPDPGEVSRVTGTQLRPVAVRESNTPGGNSSGGAFAVYRPRINASPSGNNGNSGSIFHPAPARVQTLSNVHPVNPTVYNSNRNTPNNTNMPASQPAREPANQPAHEPANQSLRDPAGQPANQPFRQPANQPAFHPANTGNNGNPNAAVTPGTTQPAPSQHQGQNANHPSTPANGNVNGHPGQQGANANQPKPHSGQGQHNQNQQHNKPKPKPNNPDNRP